MSASSDLYIIGTDEAGYGPNLGPLLVGASCWRLSNAGPSTYENFLPAQEGVSREPSKPSGRGKRKRSTSSDGPTLFDLVGDLNANGASLASGYDADFTTLAIDRLNASLSSISSRKGLFPLVDSKKLYGGSKSLAALERSYWLANGLVDRASFREPSFRTTLERVAGEKLEGSEPWEKGVDFPLPFDAKTGVLSEFERTLEEIEALFSATGIELVEILARRVQPREFNALIDRLGLKSDLIADVTTSLIAETLSRTLLKKGGSLGASTFVVLCDKLGGRDRYGSILSERFPDATLFAITEGRSSSVYRLTTRKTRDRSGVLVEFEREIAVEIRFTAKGESNVPTALASICAKYLRELSMNAFNAYWRVQVGDALVPTAGYPVDALRFRADTDTRRLELGMPEELFWRKK